MSDIVDKGGKSNYLIERLFGDSDRLRGEKGHRYFI